MPANTVPMQLIQVNIATAYATLRSTKGAMINVKRGEHLDILHLAQHKYMPLLNS